MRKKPEIEINKPGKGPFWQDPRYNWIAYLILAVLLLSLMQNFQQMREVEIPYSQFLQYVEAGRVDKVVVSDKKITGLLKPEEPEGRPRPFFTVPLWDANLTELLQKHGVEFVVRPETTNWIAYFFFSWFLPLLLLFLLWSWMAQRMAGGRNFLSLGRRARIYAESDVKVRFDDVAGCEEAKQELKEVVEFLKDPKKIQRLGGRPPKGVLLVGPPGTGKTLLARAVAGEAGVPFFSITGSEFVEMFVGVGAARVRDLFEQARQKAPCIIFIDEIDAIGRARGASPISHEEREQTLNQLLAEMDGFDPAAGVVVMAATNRPEILDKALLRPGRFDRQIVVDKPDLAGREAILRIHTRNKKLCPDVDLHVIALRTPGFVGAELENVCNEAAIIAVRRGHDCIAMEDFEAAIDRVVAGLERKTRALSPEEKARVAFHESGHAIVAEIVPTGQPIHKVSIIPRGIGALGYTLQLPVEEKFLATEEELKDQLAILLGGRSAEEIIYGNASSGAQNDLEKATEIARNMICYLGMSRKLGPATWGQRQQLAFLEGNVQEVRNYSEETARLIDAEVKEFIDEAHRRARTILEERRAALDALAERLREKEVLGGEEVKKIIEEHSRAGG
ncbi:ATP-dependent zinc metalloprotease FtsH [Methylomarinovum caldicuralii]|nr:ATP-dependent zinc metalloprotease FtsH [Methylomarinovum caldicuralii]